MEGWFAIDWAKLFVPRYSVAESLLRGTLVYLSVIVLLRLALRRQASKISRTDLLVVALIAGVCRNPLASDSQSFTDCFLIIGSVLLWSFALDWLAFHSPFLRRLLQPRPVLLVRDGRPLAENLAQECMTEEELLGKLRREGARDVTEVEEAWMGSDGEVSVVKKDLPMPRKRRSSRGSRPGQRPKGS